MNSLQTNYSLQVVLSTVLASGIMLIAGNGIADSVSDNLKNKLPPPGPYGLVDTENGAARAGNSLRVSATAPVAPESPVVKKQPFSGAAGNAPKPPKKPEARLTAPKSSLRPANMGIKHKLVIQEPVFKKTMPSIPQALKSIEAPVGISVQPAKPAMPSGKNPPSLVAAPKLSSTPPPIKSSHRKLSPPMMHHQLPIAPQSQNIQDKMPVFQGHSAMPPRIQQYRYIPLPVYQANYGYPHPSALGHAYQPGPGYWVPQPRK